MIKPLKLKPNVIAKIITVFKKNKWEIDDSIATEPSLFNRYCKMIENLTPSQQDLILMLTQNYIRIGLNRYLPLIKKALETLNGSNFSSFNCIYIMPIVAPENIGKNKSSTVMAYLFKGVEISYLRMLAEKTIHVIERAALLPTDFNNSSNALLLIDDYIGTGETAIKAIDNLKLEQDIDNSKIFILSIAAQEQGISAIQSEKGLNVYTAFRLNKALSDQYPSPQKDQLLQTMQDIEFEIEVQPKYNFGYGRSEALITLIRTPDNTFPIFWHESNESGRSITAPFPRK